MAPVQQDLQARNYEGAAATLQEKLTSASSGDRLAYLLEYAVVLHQAGQFKDSNDVLDQAEELWKKNNYTSVTREAGALLVNEGLVQFKLEPYEDVLMTAYRALNYTLLGDYENAQVMARKINEKLTSMEVEESAKQWQSGLGYYLAGLMLETQYDIDNALILYRKALGLMPPQKHLISTIYTCTQRARRSDLKRKLLKEHPELKKQTPWSRLRKQGEFVFIYQQGWVPRKQYRPENRSFAQLGAVYSEYNRAELIINDKSVAETEMLYDLAGVSQKIMNDNYGKMVARFMAREAARQAVAHGLNKNKNALGDLAYLVLRASDKADLRHWSLLPSSFQVLRTYLKAGTHKVRVEATSTRGGEPLVLFEEEVIIKPGKKVYKTSRSFY